MRFRTLVAAVALAGSTLVAGSAFAQSAGENAIINSMKDVYTLMSEEARTAVNTHLDEAQKALKANDHDGYTRAIDAAMMLIAKELYDMGSRNSTNG
ncbi:MAG: hypothetical protein RLY86_1216 [Pseudomonadota bacterium]|jgi:hypothetical protein